MKTIIAYLLMCLMLLANSVYAGEVKIVQKSSGNQSPVIVGKGNSNIVYNNKSSLPHLSGGETTVKIVNIPSCQQRLYDALEKIVQYTEPSTGYGVTTLEYRTPSDRMREAADRMDARDNAINEAMTVLKECKP